jgi:hypothetical protein
VLDAGEESYPAGNGRCQAASQVCGPLDDQASPLVDWGEVVPFFMTPSLAIGGPPIAKELVAWPFSPPVTR